MSYNIHPIFVHFPIALLCIYSIIKILPFTKWFPSFAWRDVERVLLLIGVAGAFGAFVTGETAEHLVRPDHKLVEAHSTFAGISTWLYVSLLVGEISSYILGKRILTVPDSSQVGFVVKVLLFFKKYFTTSFITKSISLIALVSLAIAGLLGGVMVYGTTADPLAGFVLRILGIV